jgi:hypothetical protein
MKKAPNWVQGESNKLLLREALPNLAGMETRASLTRSRLLTPIRCLAIRWNAQLLFTVNCTTMKNLMEQSGMEKGRAPAVFARGRGYPGGWKWPFLLLFWWIGVVGPLWSQSQAPCAITCLANDPNFPLVIDPGDSCRSTLTFSMFMFITGCPGDKTLAVRGGGGQIIATGINSVSVNLTSQIGQQLEVTVVDVGTGITCVGFARILDRTAPVIMCRDTVLPCSADTSVAVLGRPRVVENCDASVVLTYSDQVQNLSCGDTSAIILRTWLARDASGNRDTCIQRIALRRAVLADVVFPRDTTISCTTPANDPFRLGFPSWSANQIVNGGGLCRFVIRFRDETTQTCGSAGRVIDRIWTVEDLCALQTRTVRQTIRIVDNIAPVIQCPPTKIAYTLPGECFSTVNLDRPTVSDGCDPSATFLVTTSYGQVGLGPHFNVPAGTHTITYTGVDACLNTAVCQTTLRVLDEERPIAICDDEIVIALNQHGKAFSAARTFNEGSRDNCVGTLYYKIRRMTTNGCGGANGDDSSLPGYQEWFDDLVQFCCEDVGTKVQVIVRVYTVNPGPGPVNPLREEPGGDLFGTFNECMSLAQIKDPFPPQLYCPATDTAECVEDLSNLARYGSPVLLSGCGSRLDSSVVTTLDNCGRGMVRRTFTATNPQNLTTTCTQVIMVENNQRLTTQDITWPRNTTLSTCGVSIEPGNLPTGSQRPQISRQPPCGLIGISYEDKTYNLVASACYTVHRTWTLIDWCLFDPSKSTTLGKFSYTQIIEIADRQPPNFVCPGDITVPATNGCASGQVTLPALVAADNCSPQITISHDSPFAASPGANVSGTYPLGSTVVTYRIADGCGNLAVCKIRINVVDQKPPAILCIEGLSTSVAQMPGGIMAMVDAKTFDKNTSDNCTANANIRFSIRRPAPNQTIPPTARQITFDCSDLGLQPVEVWATDESGNSTFCLTSIRITDFSNVCPPDIGLGNVAGAISTEKGDKVEKVSMVVRADKPMQVLTDVQGVFKLANIPFGQDYTIVPQRNDDLLNGISTLDLVQISRHILGLQPFTSPYQWVAADIDKSGTVSTSDIIRLRRLILNLETSLPNGNTSWRFVDANYKFPTTGNPLTKSFPETVNFNNFREKDAKVNFVAVKVGDVNGSAIPNSLMQSESRTTGGEMVIRVRDKVFRAGETFTVDLVSSDIGKVSGYQFTLDFDERLLELAGMDFGNLPDVGLENFGFGAIAEGRILTSWNKGASTVPSGDVVMFKLTFKAKRNSDLFNALAITDTPTRAEAFNPKSELMQVLLKIIDAQGAVREEGGFELLQNFPNPFSEKTYIGFNLPKAAPAALRIFDMSGRLVYTHQGNFGKGYNEIQIDKTQFGLNHGIFYYQLSSESFNATRKMIMNTER